MDEKTLEDMLKRAPDLVEILDYFILISEDTFYHRYHCGADDKDCIDYNLLYDLITDERYYSYVYALFYDFAVPGDNLCVGFLDDNNELESIDVSRAMIARSIINYQE